MTNVKELREKAKSYKIIGCGKMKKADLEYAINQYEGCGNYIGNLSVKEVRKFAKSVGLKNVSKKSKSQLIQELKDTQIGSGLFRDFFNLIGKSVKKVSNSAPIKIIKEVAKKTPIIKDVVNFLDYRKGFKKGTERTLKEIGNIPIFSLKIFMCPIQSWIKSTLNVMSFGFFVEQMEDKGFDKLYHLSMVATLQDGRKVLIEKNEEINVSFKLETCEEGGRSINVSKYNSSLNYTINEMLEKTLERVGEKVFYDYDGFKYNCQRFIKDILESNNLATPELLGFFYQDLTEMYNKLEEEASYLTPIMKGFTRIGAIKNKVLGQGVNDDLQGGSEYSAFIQTIANSQKFNGKKMNRISKDLILKSIPKRFHTHLKKRLETKFKKNYNKSEGYYEPNPLLNKTKEDVAKDFWLPFYIKLDEPLDAYDDKHTKRQKLIIHENGFVNYSNGVPAGDLFIYKNEAYISVYSKYNSTYYTQKRITCLNVSSKSIDGIGSPYFNTIFKPKYLYNKDNELNCAYSNNDEGFFDMNYTNQSLWKKWREDGGKVLHFKKYKEDRYDDLSDYESDGEIDTSKSKYGRKRGRTKKGSGIPNEAVIFDATKNSYDTNAPKKLPTGFDLILDSPTLDAYLRESDKTILIGIRGTDTKDTNDLKADAVLIFNGLRYTTRYKNDKEKMEDLIEAYPPSEYDYVLGSHSLAGAISKQLTRDYPFIKKVVSYNSAFQTADLTNQKHDQNIKRYYTENDFLYNLGGRFFKNSIVLPSTEEKAKSFFSRLKSMLPSSKIKSGLEGHNLDNFNKLYEVFQAQMKKNPYNMVE